MKRNRKRTLAKLLLFFTLLGTFCLLAEGLLFAAEGEDAVISLPFEAPFAMKHDYIVMTLAAVLLLFAVSVLLFIGAKKPQKPGRRKKSKYKPLTEPICKEEDPGAVQPVAVSDAPISKSVKIDRGAQEASSASKLILPLVGGFILGATVATVLCKKTQKAPKTKPSVYVFGLNKRK
ncbi:MAG: hypothetical protein E7637_01110 [Ruminococcaceae bacterium]|nr:hypothetical protein [Oscillospiraceae bacterium]